MPILKDNEKDKLPRLHLIKFILKECSKSSNRFLLPSHHNQAFLKSIWVIRHLVLISALQPPAPKVFSQIILFIDVLKFKQEKTGSLSASRWIPYLHNMQWQAGLLFAYTDHLVFMFER